MFCDVVIIHITSLSVINPTLDCITFYNLCLLKLRQESTVNISLRFLLYQLPYLSFLDLPFYPEPILYAVTGKYVTFLYVLCSVVHYTHIILYNGFLNQ